jgi:hypothetical protein
MKSSFAVRPFGGFNDKIKALKRRADGFFDHQYSRRFMLAGMHVYGEYFLPVTAGPHRSILNAYFQQWVPTGTFLFECFHWFQRFHFLICENP